MPALTKEALSKFIRTECRRQLRLYLSPDNARFRAERESLDMPPPQPPRPGLVRIVEEGREWEAEKLHDLREAFGNDTIIGQTTTHQSGQVRYQKIELREALSRVKVDQFIVEAEFDVSATFEQAMIITTYRADFGLVYGRLRPDIISVCQPGRFTQQVQPSGDLAELAPDDGRLQLRVIDIKLTAEPSPSYFAEVAYYSTALAGWLIDQRLDDRFVVVPDGAIWCGSHEAANLTIAKQEARHQARVLTAEDLYRALESDLEVAPFEVFAFRLRRFLQHDLCDALSQPWQAQEWHVDNRCSGCEYLGYPRISRDGTSTHHDDHCLPTATRVDHLSRVAFIPRGATAALRGSAIARATDLADLPVVHTAFGLHQTLRATRTVISGRARCLQTGEPVIPDKGGSSAVMPRWADLRIYVSADFDLGSAISFALGLSAFWVRPHDAPPGALAHKSWAGEVYAVDRRNIDDEQRELLGFLRRIDEIIEEARTLTGQVPSVQVYIWDSLQYDHLVRIVGRHLEAILADQTIRRLAWLFPPEDVLPNPALASRSSAITVVNEVVRAVVAAPIPHYYTLLGLARVYHRDDLEPEHAKFNVHPLFEGELSDQIPSERAHEIWAHATRPHHWLEQLTILRRTVLMRLRALEEVTRRLGDDLRERLGLTAPRANLGPATTESRISVDGQLWYAFARLNVALASLEVDQIRAMPAHEREARYHSARLRRRLLGDEEIEALGSFGLVARSGRRVYEMRETSREVKLSEDDFNLALSPENDPIFLDRNFARLIQGTPLEQRFGQAAWRRKMDAVTAVTVVKLDRARRLIVLDQSPFAPLTLDELEAAQLQPTPGITLSFQRHVVLDRVNRDFFTSKLKVALRGVGNPPSAVDRHLVRRATGQLSGRGAHRTPHVPAADVLWDSKSMSQAMVVRSLDGPKARLRQIGLDLNDGQWRAWETALSRRLALIWGPPGTGKSRTAQAVVLGAILEAHEQGRPLRVLITASTYNAADNVLLPVYRLLRDHLSAIPVQVARLRSHWRSREPGLPAEIDQVINVRDPSSDQLELCAGLAEKSGIILVSGPPEQVYNLLVAEDQPVCQPLFDLILFDEASQTDVAHAILPLCALAGGGSVVLAGDPLQLPPIHQAEPPRDLEAMVGSIYEFCEQQHNVLPEMLEVNYRSNALLVELARPPGYRSGLRSFSEELRLSLVEPLPQSCPPDWPVDLFRTPEWSALLDPARPAVCFVYADGRSSQWNRFEADAVVALLTLLNGRLASQLAGECDVATGLIRPQATTPYAADDFWRQAVGVVTPHRAQRALIVERLQELHGSNVTDPRLIADAVDTVERFQGQQRDLIVASFALGDPDAIRDEDEFLMMLNRFNVMASRARAKLIVLVTQEIVDHLSGDLDTLRQSRLLKSFVESFCRQGRPMTLGWIRDQQPQTVQGVFRSH